MKYTDTLKYKKYLHAWHIVADKSISQLLIRYFTMKNMQCFHKICILLNKAKRFTRLPTNLLTAYELEHHITLYDYFVILFFFICVLPQQQKITWIGATEFKKKRSKGKNKQATILRNGTIR